MVISPMRRPLIPEKKCVKRCRRHYARSIKPSIAVANAAKRLDFSQYMILAQTFRQGELQPPETKNMGQLLSNMPRISSIKELAAQRLFECVTTVLTAEKLATLKPEDPSEFILYHRLTPFGIAVAQFMAQEIFSQIHIEGHSLRFNWKD